MFKGEVKGKIVAPAESRNDLFRFKSYRRKQDAVGRGVWTAVPGTRISKEDTNSDGVLRSARWTRRPSQRACSRRHHEHRHGCSLVRLPKRWRPRHPMISSTTRRRRLGLEHPRHRGGAQHPRPPGQLGRRRDANGGRTPMLSTRRSKSTSKAQTPQLSVTPPLVAASSRSHVPSRAPSPVMTMATTRARTTWPPRRRSVGRPPLPLPHPSLP